MWTSFVCGISFDEIAIKLSMNSMIQISSLERPWIHYFEPAGTCCKCLLGYSMILHFKKLSVWPNNFEIVLSHHDFALSWLVLRNWIYCAECSYELDSLLALGYSALFFIPTIVYTNSLLEPMLRLFHVHGAYVTPIAHYSFTNWCHF